ncbi:SGNH/GDSL hydrolase family protein [Salinibacillus xinjiangensis]|uniref:Uncharacterized protein n=1 Tax=Salinibacillus xinjiangensis TaxID=1229268 RepID=A0A6G1X219_9BACI|nr:SGNH/GDSL hydrolase family protein [Salinibacillus xinjiangensis]MRG84935.1 hypothetical protein [Salinibacillus xinjiangensis]
MKRKLGIFLIITMLIALILIVFVGPKYQEIKLENLQTDRSLTASSSKTESSEDLGLYDKLKESKSIDILVMGNRYKMDEPDSLWIDRFKKSIHNQYDSETNVDFLTTEEDRVFRLLADYSNAELESYDLILLTIAPYGSNDEQGDQNFRLVFENLLRTVMSNNPNTEIIPVIEYGVDYEKVDQIQNLTQYYGLTYVDIKHVIESSKSSNSEYILEDQLNDEGHQLASDELFERIRAHMFQNKRNNHQVEEFLHSGAERFSSIQVISDGGQVDEPLSFNFTGEIIGLTFQMGSDHGIVDIYLDGEYLRSIDTYSSDGDSEKTFLLNSQLADSEHVITIQPSLLTNENAEGSERELVRVITN